MTQLPTDYDGHVMRTPDEWCRIKQIQILDPDGWRGHDAKDWSEPLTELDFEERAQVCTQRSTAGEHQDAYQTIRRQVTEEIAAALTERRNQINETRPGWVYMGEAVRITKRVGGIA